MSSVKGIVSITHAKSSYLFANAKPVFSISLSVIATGTVKLIFFKNWLFSIGLTTVIIRGEEGGLQRRGLLGQ